MKERKIIFYVQAIVVVFYFLFFRVFLSYFLFESRGLFNAVVIIFPQEGKIRHAHMITGEKKRELDFLLVQEKNRNLWFCQFSDIPNIKGFYFDIDSDAEVWLGKKFSFSPKPFLLIKLIRENNGEYGVPASLFAFVGFLGWGIVFFLDISMGIFGLLLLQRRVSREFAVVVIISLFLSNIGIVDHMHQLQGPVIKILMWIAWGVDVCLGIWLLTKFFVLKTKTRAFLWEDIIFGLIVVLLFWNVNGLNFSWVTKRMRDTKTIILGAIGGREYRARMGYGQYGALYDVGQMIQRIASNSTRIGLPGGDFPVFGNGSLVRRFIYPHVDMVLDTEKLTNEKLLLAFCKEKQIDYLVVVKKGMDSYAPYRSWPSFRVPSEGIYCYNVKSGEIKFVAEEYRPEKYLTNYEEYILIKLKEYE